MDTLTGVLSTQDCMGFHNTIESSKSLKNLQAVYFWNCFCLIFLDIVLKPQKAKLRAVEGVGVGNYCNLLDRPQGKNTL